MIKHLISVFRAGLHIVSYAILNRWVFVLITLLIIGFAVLLNITREPWAKDTQEFWSDNIETWVGIGTFFVAFAVWWAEVAQEWKNSLPKRLTVEFLFEVALGEKKILMRCEKAHLSDIADIRSLGQQIGSQLVNPDNPDRTLSFKAPFVRQEPGGIKFSNDPGFFTHYHVEFVLTKLPNDLEPDECKVWVTPFDKSDIRTCKPESK